METQASVPVTQFLGPHAVEAMEPSVHRSGLSNHLQLTSFGCAGGHLPVFTCRCVTWRMSILLVFTLGNLLLWLLLKLLPTQVYLANQQHHVFENNCMSQQARVSARASEYNLSSFASARKREMAQAT